MARSNEFGIASYGRHLFGAWSPKVVGPPRAFRRASRDCSKFFKRICANRPALGSYWTTCSMLSMIVRLGMPCVISFCDTASASSTMTICCGASGGLSCCAAMRYSSAVQFLSNPVCKQRLQDHSYPLAFCGCRRFGRAIRPGESAAIFPNSGDKFGVGNEPAHDMGNADLVAQALGNRGKQASHARQGVVKQRL